MTVEYKKGKNWSNFLALRPGSKVFYLILMSDHFQLGKSHHYMEGLLFPWIHRTLKKFSPNIFLYSHSLLPYTNKMLKDPQQNMLAAVSLSCDKTL